MSLARLLDARRVALLRRRLRARLPGVPASGLLSITLDLGAGDDDWLGVDLARANVNWWAEPGGREVGDYRLALGEAMRFSTAGGGRFAALQAAFRGLAPLWEHDDAQHTGVRPAAHVGFAFAEETQDELPNARLLVPAILLRNQAGQRTVTFSCSARAAEGAVGRWLAELHAADGRPAAAAPAGPATLWQRRPAALADRAFLARASAALAGIARGELDKLVLTRSVHVASELPVAAASVLAVLARRHPECTIYGVGQPGQSFIGATPERLVSLRAGTVRADALAGTAWLGAAAGQPTSRALQADKNRREHQLVVDAVRAALLPMCVSLEAPRAAAILHLGQLQHLHTTVVGRARTGIGLFDLIASLHPTPAVGGVPGPAARQWLLRHGDRRGAWYTGGVGWIDRDGDGDVAVALRCARLRGRDAELFAGAGIVAGSDPEQELAETEVKLAVIAAALRCPRACAPGQARRTGTG